jgi:hypothetical protein
VRLFNLLSVFCNCNKESILVWVMSETINLGKFNIVGTTVGVDTTLGLDTTLLDTTLGLDTTVLDTILGLDTTVLDTKGTVDIVGTMVGATCIEEVDVETIDVETIDVETIDVETIDVNVKIDLSELNLSIRI